MISHPYFKLLLGIIILSLYSCGNEQETSGFLAGWMQKREARKDLREYLRSYNLMKNVENSVTPDAETMPVLAKNNDDAADDPAWFTLDYNDSTHVLIAGSNKLAGIHLYRMNGDTAGFYEVGKINNIDCRKILLSENDSITVLAGSNRDLNSIIVIAPPVKSGNQEPVTTNIPTSLDAVYGFCLYHSSVSGNLFAFVNSKSGKIEQYRLDLVNNRISGSLVRKLSVRSQPEGMVADDRTGILYVGEEKGGIHFFDAEPTGSAASSVIKGSDRSNSLIHSDIEGLGLYRSGTRGGFLIASSQGNFSYAVFDLKSHSYITSFRIEESNDIDGVEETDGIEIIDFYISSEYPEGALIVQDGYNTSGSVAESQNFKIIDWRKIKSILPAISGD
jgi:3-phytase